ncbi:MAG: hypothetical protein JJU05_16990 [Verrucomicrobia bacterium]|nr:hypothetical protein [Verrucomicrobiota bacterium]
MILDQQLLGRPAPEPARPQPETQPAAPPPAWTTEYRLTMITEDLFSGRARVGLYHVRNQVGYLLIEGETYTDHTFTLQSVDYDQSRAVIVNQGARHTFSLESAPIQTAAPESSSQASSQATGRAAPNNRTVRRVVRPPSASEPQAPPEPPPEPRFSSPEDLQAHLQNVQMDAIRTGKPPLPIPLTPEMDAQLVQEGVLPPLEE